MIVKAMDEYINNAEVCRLGCGALLNIANNGKQKLTSKTPFSHFKKSDYNRVKAGQAGAIEMIVKAMSTHINNADVCKCGCGALLSIIINGKQKPT